MPYRHLIPKTVKDLRALAARIESLTDEEKDELGKREAFLVFSRQTLREFRDTLKRIESGSRLGRP